MPPTPAYYDDLDLTLAEAWRLITRGALDRRSAMHTVQIATIRADGAPSMRTVVLRAAEGAARTLRFHTDARSVKVAEIARDPRLAIHAYDPGAKIQLRFDTVASILGGDDAAPAWAASQPMSRVCYRVARAPGDAIADPQDGLPPMDGAPQDGRDVFRVVECRVTRLEWLYLASAGHRRARFDFAPATSARWLVP